jgi:hypothetical protein
MTYYIKYNGNEPFDENYKKIIETIMRFNELIKNKKIIKNGSYYPRLTDTDKRGLRAYNELKKKHFTENLHSFPVLNEIIRCKFFPQYDNGVIVVNDNNFKSLMENIMIDKLKIQNEPFDAVVNNVNNLLSSEDKLNQIEDMIDNLDLTPKEILKLIPRLTKLLVDYV